MEVFANAAATVLIAVVLLVIGEWTKRLVFDPADRLRDVVLRTSLWLSRDGHALGNAVQGSISEADLKDMFRAGKKLYEELRVANGSMIGWGWIRALVKVPSHSSAGFACMALLIMNNEYEQRFRPDWGFNFNDMIAKVHKKFGFVDGKNSQYQEELKYRPL